MIKKLFIKKENIFILSIVLFSLLCIIVGFLLLFFRQESSVPKNIPVNVYDIRWSVFDSDILNKKIQYPDYMFVTEQKNSSGVGLSISEVQNKSFLNYFSNQNHVSIYPEGMDNQLFYGKTKETEYTSSTGQKFKRTEYLTIDNKVWAIMLVPEDKTIFGETRGFIWIQSIIKKKESLCISSKGVLINNVTCDPYSGELPVYRGEVSQQFIRFGYEIINKNSF